MNHFVIAEKLANLLIECFISVFVHGIIKLLQKATLNSVQKAPEISFQKLIITWKMGHRATKSNREIYFVKGSSKAKCDFEVFK